MKGLFAFLKILQGIPIGMIYTFSKTYLNREVFDKISFHLQKNLHKDEDFVEYFGTDNFYKIVDMFTSINVETIDIETGEVSETKKQKSLRSVSDFILDYDVLVGKKVAVEGYMLVAGTVSWLYETPQNTMLNISLNFKSLDRELQKKLMKNCAAGCKEMIIEGIAENTMYNKGIKVTGIFQK